MLTIELKDYCLGVWNSSKQKACYPKMQVSEQKFNSADMGHAIYDIKTDTQFNIIRWAILQ